MPQQLIRRHTQGVRELRREMGWRVRRLPLIVRDHPLRRADRLAEFRLRKASGFAQRGQTSSERLLLAPASPRRRSRAADRLLFSDSSSSSFFTCEFCPSC